MEARPSDFFYTGQAMAKLGLTMAQVDGLTATGKLQRIRVPDNPGLYLQVAAKPGRSGAVVKSWIFRYSRDLSHVWLTIGTYPKMSISKAEAEGERLRGGLRGGLDPREMVKPKPVRPPAPAPAPIAPKTVNQLLDAFNETMGELRESTRTEYIRFLRIKVREWVDPEGRIFGERAAMDITGADAAALLAACRVKASRTSTMVAIKMHQCWEYGMTLGFPFLPDKRNIWKGQIRPKINKKDRHFSETELVLFGERLRTSNEPEDCKIGYQLYLLVGMRHSNLAHAKWQWVDLTKRLMVVPQDDHKTGNRTKKPLKVLLSSHAVALLKRLKALRDADPETKGSPWLYPKRGDKMGHRDDLNDPWERIRKGQSWSDVNVHDLRRTLASTLSSLGYKGYASEVLGHAGTSVTDIYTHTSTVSMLKMLEEAGDRITGLMAGKLKPEVVGDEAEVATPDEVEAIPVGVGEEDQDHTPPGSKAVRMVNTMATATSRGEGRAVSGTDRNPRAAAKPKKAARADKGRMLKAKR